MPDFGRRDNPGASEFGWGSGLTPPGLEDAPPARGGRYRGKTPPMPSDAALDALQRLIDGEDN